jgi:hypothetical protein
LDTLLDGSQPFMATPKVIGAGGLLLQRMRPYLFWSEGSKFARYENQMQTPHGSPH